MSFNFPCPQIENGVARSVAKKFRHFVILMNENAIGIELSRASLVRSPESTSVLAKHRGATCRHRRASQGSEVRFLFSPRKKRPKCKMCCQKPKSLFFDRFMTFWDCQYVQKVLETHYACFSSEVKISCPETFRDRKLMSTLNCSFSKLRKSCQFVSRK